MMIGIMNKRIGDYHDKQKHVIIISKIIKRIDDHHDEQTTQVMIIMITKGRTLDYHHNEYNTEYHHA